jgi:delta24-sterol reductase
LAFSKCYKRSQKLLKEFQRYILFVIKQYMKIHEPENEQGLRKRAKIQQEKSTIIQQAYSAAQANPFINKLMDTIAIYYSVLRNRALDFMTEQRGIFVVLFLLPISFVFDFFWYLSQLYITYGMRANSPASHEKRVKRVQDSIRKAREEGHTKFCTARPGWLATSFRTGLYKTAWAKIDLNDFKYVLDVDTKRRVIRCEPLCSMGQLSHELSRLGWCLAVTPELDDLTVGGLIMGFGIETSSHRHGLFQHICTALEVVMPDGRFLRCTAEENSDMFYALPWSHGTIGFLVAAEIEVI